MSQFKLFFAAIALIGSGLATDAAFAAQGDAVGDTQTCLDLGRIDSSPVIDEKTILVKMKAPKSFKRIDLAQPCGLDTMRPFAHSTTTNQLCKQDTLTVMDGSRSVCMIKQILTISEDEAKSLEKGPRK